MFSEADRERLREALVAAAYGDDGVIGAAVTGSAAVGAEDRWSDIDLAFAPAADFGAIAPTFRLLFGAANDRPPASAPAAAELIGWGWLYALHARSSIARGRGWQAEYMISGVRDQVLALACLRHGVPVVQARGVDSLPPETTAAFAAGLVRSLDDSELRRAFRVARDGLVAEIAQFDADLAGRLAAPLRQLAG